MKSTTPKPTLEELARDVLADKWDRFPDGDYTGLDFEPAAHSYLDDLADGYETVDEFLALLAEGIARIDHNEVAYWRSERGRSHLEFSDWYDGREREYLERACESYAPAKVAA